MSQNSPITYQFKIPNLQGGDPFVVNATIGADGTLILNGISVTGLGLTTAGVTDSSNKRFVTDAELAALNSLTGLLTESLLATNPGVDVNSASPTTLYTVPVGKSCIPTKFILRNASISLTTASLAFGFNSPTFNNVIATATHTELTGATLFTILSPKVGSKVGVAGDLLSVLPTILQGAAATLTIDVYGYLF